MPFSRFMRQAVACRISSAVFILALFAAQSLAAATLTGRVTDPDGSGIPRAKIVIATATTSVAESTTDATGAFQVAGLGAGRYDVRVLANGFQAEPIAITVTADENRDVSVAMRLSAVNESILVTASQVDVPLSRAGSSVTVITGAELQARQVETVADALRLVPGLDVNRSGGRGAITSLFPRGGGSHYTLVLIDGVRANAFGGGYDFAHLSTANVDRVEIVRGPQSAQFGSDAVGAVVQIVTRRGGRPTANALVEGGSQGSVRTVVGASGSHGDWRFGAGAEKTRSDGFTGAAANGETVSNDDYHLSDGSASIGWQKPSGPDFLATVSIERDERGFPGPFGSDPIGVFSGVDRISRGTNDTRQVGGRFAHGWSSRIRQRVEANYTDISSDFASSFGPSTSGTKRFDSRVQEDLIFSPALSASAGLEFLREQGRSSFIVGAVGQEIPIKRSVLGTFAELRYVGSERLSITGGVRLDRLSRNALEADGGFFSSRPTAFPDQTTNSFNPKISVSYLVTPADRSSASTRLRASAGTGIRPPEAFEVSSTDNPNLKPERSRSVDAGVEQQFAGGAYALGATVFFNNYDDLIITVGRSLQNASRYKSDNISNARARGLELSGDARLTRAFTLHANYTFLATEFLSVDGLSNLAQPPFQVGDALFRRPRHHGSADLTYAAGRLGAFLELTSRGQILDIEPNFGTFGGLFFSPGYTVLNAGGSVRVARGLEGYVRVLNLADRSYEETLGFPALGRSVMAGVRIAASR